MKKVGVVGYGSTKFSQDDVKAESLLLSATKSLFKNTPSLSQKDIDVVLTSTNDNTKYLSAILSELSGIKPKISHTVENLCSSGSNAIVSAFSYIASGLADIALIAGADRYDSPGQILEWDLARGEFKHPIFWASIFTKSYKKEFGVSEENLAMVSAKNHKNAKDNPFAYSTKHYSLEDVLNSKHITEDLRLLDCSRPCSGGSALLLVSETKANNFTDTPIWIKGIGQKTISASFAKISKFTQMESTKIASKQAYQMSNLEPKDVDVVEIHDAFTVCEPMAIEDLGFAEKGKGANFTREMYETENKKINPRGGIIGSGHPLGATGISQAIEITQQLQNNAGKRQIEGAKIGLVHNMSAAATSSTVLLLQS